MPELARDGFKGELPGDYFSSRKIITHQWAVNSTFTGTGTLTLRTPTSSLRFILRAWHLVIAVKTQLAAANGITVLFYDGTTARPGPGLAFFPAKAQAGDGRISYVDQFDGWASGAAERSLLIGASDDISTGVIRVSGVAYGSEER